ncbi:glycosyltransferase family 2 protein [Marinobacter sp. NFXS9]|uniref:glycosyltransferase family 2 protein n=1 Tax=Marinobacter sp. NFXS9 TaxID=2818433 RepID=UPI0032DFB6EF
MKISVVIPAKDESENIDPLVAEIHRAVDGVVPFQVIVVDDGSTDGTGDVALKTGERLGCEVKCVRHLHSVGQSTAVLTGVRHADGEWIVTMDGDGQNDPADIPAMIECAKTMKNDIFCIAGYRKARKDTAWKRFQSKLANRVRDALLHDGCPDTGCGLKLFPRSTFLSLPYFDHMHRFLPALIRSQGGDIEVVVVSHRDRQRGQSKYSAWNRVWVGIVDLFGVMWLQRRAKVPVIARVDDTKAG